MAHNTGFASLAYPTTPHVHYRPRLERRDGPFTFGPFPHEQAGALRRLLSSATQRMYAEVTADLASVTVALHDWTTPHARTGRA